MYRKLYVFYLDQGQHFLNNELKEFLRSQGIAVNYSSSDAFKSTGMIKVSNKILEEILRKQLAHIDSKNWNIRLLKIGSKVNTRIIDHLDIAFTGILFEPLQEPFATMSTLLALPERNIRDWIAELEDSFKHSQTVRQYLVYRAELHNTVRARSDLQKQKMTNRYNREVNEATHYVGDLVMLFQKNTGKLEPRWRGPFQISDYGGAYDTSFTLLQLNERKIYDTFHDDHLKIFVSQTEYLIDSSSPLLPQQQTIRRARRKLPRHDF